ncbi:SpoIIE family protein phosphatase, partial [candidate division KSB1 bacterium]|nr:SpoIIE family protein phosphatase [candidate division KSB1 bacterium]
FIMWNGIIIFAVLAVLIGIAVTAWNKKIDPNQLKQFVPPYIHRMKERERIKKELEIARKVQLSFLPNEVPRYPGIEVSTVCIPANEVGGDYFDFIDLGDDKFGVVIGDVSGKGIPAAFHMTLTKGFLKAQVKESYSPRDVLVKMNELFYENVRRGNFISMIYGVFDLKDQSFTFSRAGHNPVIIRSDQKQKIEQLCPKGIALGLEKGAVFGRFIEEMQIKISKNDMFVLYTDGVSEAMNDDKIEFGEDRLENIVKANSYLSAKEMIELIQQKIRDFVGNTAQHDDMTMIIVKIL